MGSRGLHVTSVQCVSRHALCSDTFIYRCRDQSGPVIAFAITAGLTAGSLLALALVAALQTQL